MRDLFLTRFFVTAVCALSIATLFYVFFVPMPSMHRSNDGIKHFTPNVINPVTGETIRIKKLVRHFKGE
jgi:hypothetical protein